MEPAGRGDLGKSSVVAESEGGHKLGLFTTFDEKVEKLADGQSGEDRAAQRARLDLHVRWI